VAFAADVEHGAFAQDGAPFRFRQRPRPFLIATAGELKPLQVGAPGDAVEQFDQLRVGLEFRLAGLAAGIPLKDNAGP